jgi:hypothetical protein
LPAGYSGKLLGKDGSGKKQKRMWPIGREAMFGTLGLKIILIEDEAATARTLALRTRGSLQSALRNVCRISATLPKALAGPPSLSIAGGRQKRGSKYG